MFGNVRGAAPVASSAPSNGSDSSPSRVRSRPAASSAVARTPRRSSTSSSSYGVRRNASSWGPHSPASSCFDSGGRSYGRCGSAPTSTIRPSNPSRRSVSVARSPASEAPTTTTVRTPPLSSPQGACAPRRPSVVPGPGHERASTLVQGGGQGSMLRRSPGIRHGAENTGARSGASRLSRCEHSEYLLRSNLCQTLPGSPPAEGGGRQRRREIVSDWRIDELAQRAGIAVDTIRYYQREGLLPSGERNGRTRRFGPEHLERLERIRALQSRRFSLAAIRALLEQRRPGRPRRSPRRLRGGHLRPRRAGRGRGGLTRAGDAAHRRRAAPRPGRARALGLRRRRRQRAAQLRRPRASWRSPTRCWSRWRASTPHGLDEIQRCLVEVFTVARPARLGPRATSSSSGTCSRAR